MENPTQSLLHITNIGERVRSLRFSDPAKFMNETNQPIRNVNKYGLLHYSIPKSLDTLQFDNSIFRIEIRYRDDSFVQFNVRLPLMDYYREIAEDNLGDSQPMASFCELLQTSINWSIQNAYAGDFRRGAMGSVGKGANGPLDRKGTLSVGFFNRLACIVELTKSDDADDAPPGRLRFTFGYRGNLKTFDEDGKLDNGSEYKAGEQYVVKNSGSPFDNNQVNKPDGVDFPWILANTTNQYNWIDTRGEPTITTTFNSEGVNRASNDEMTNGLVITQVAIFNLSRRMRMFLGCETDTIVSAEPFEVELTNETTGKKSIVFPNAHTRGRITLVNYPANGGMRSEMITVVMHKPANLSPPSFLLLNLTTQGTRSRVLGHGSERSGWAVPTPSDGYRSRWNNFPDGLSNNGTYSYGFDNVRNIPYLRNAGRAMIEKYGNLKDIMKTVDPGTNVMFPQKDRYDQKAIGADLLVFQDDDDEEFYERDNYSLVPIDYGIFAGGDSNTHNNHRFGSRFIHYGDTHRIAAFSRSLLKSTYFRISPAFTVSMVNPNWLYTQVENSTVQTLDVQLAWGDTAENVTDSERNAVPAQFSLIASK